jgi:hypothetical protein
MVRASGLDGIMIAVVSDLAEKEVDRVGMVARLGKRLRVKGYEMSELGTIANGRKEKRRIADNRSRFHDVTDDFYPRRFVCPRA